MPVRIRLSRGGAKKRPFFRIVIADSRRARDGKFIERIGTYNPMLEKDNPDRVKIDIEKAKEQNNKLYELIREFYVITGIPMLLNTSFNRHEPIVETPQNAIRTFKRTGLDMLIINDWIIRKWNTLTY